MNHDRLDAMMIERAGAIFGFGWVTCRIVQLSFFFPPLFFLIGIFLTHTDASDEHIVLNRFPHDTHNLGFSHNLNHICRHISLNRGRVYADIFKRISGMSERGDSQVTSRMRCVV